MRHTTPKEIDTMVEKLLERLSISSSTAQWFNYTIPHYFIPEINECHINAWLQLEYEKSGTISSGWIIWQQRETQFIEAMFHSVWCNDNGKLIDVTPRQDGEEKVLFVPDPIRKIRLTEFKGYPAIKSYDNVRMQSGKLLTNPDEAVCVIGTKLIYEHGLAIKTSEAKTCTFEHQS